MAYIELHARSAFSFLRGASLPEHLAEMGAKQGLSAMALCDRNGVYGAPRFYASAQEHGLFSIVGSELTLEDGSVLPVLVMNRTGLSKPVPDDHPQPTPRAKGRKPDIVE